MGHMGEIVPEINSMPRLIWTEMTGATGREAGEWQ